MRKHRYVYRNAAEGDGASDGGGGDPGASGGTGSGDAGNAGSGDAGNGDAGGDGASGGASDQAAKGYFETLPDDWRAQLAGGDEKKAAQLERVLDMKTFSENYFNAQDKIRSGELSNGLPENPTDEQLSDWREANGIPTAADAYDVKLADGLAMDEGDERIMSHLYEVAHAHNLSNDALSEIASTLLKGGIAEAEAAIAEDGIHEQTAERQLREAWGQDYQRNVNMARGLTAKLPEAIRESFEQARMPDGKGIFNSPEVMVFLADMARQIDPLGTVVPNSANPVQSVKDEIAKLEARMTEPDWFKDTAANNRLEELYEAEERLAQNG